MKNLLKGKNQQQIALMILGFIILVIFFFLVIMPFLRKLKLLAEDEKAFLVKLGKAKTAVEDKEKLYGEVSQIQKSIKYFEKRLPKNTDTPQILEDLIMIGKATNITFVSIAPQEIEKINVSEEGDKYYLGIPIRLQLKAGFHDFGRFVNKIENSERFMKIADISINSNPRDIKKHNINLTVSAFALEGEIRNINEKNEQNP